MPGPHGRPPMDMRNMKNMDTKSLGRVFSYLFKNYTVHLIIVVICIIITAITTLYGTLFMNSLVDDYITPLVNAKAAGLEPDFGPLAGAILKLVGIYAVGIVTSYAYNRIMVNVSQGSLRNLRNDLFSHMETLPIKYFDTHAHGDIMSIYTNDIDTLRQLIGQSIPQLINSTITVIMSFVSMIVLNIPLTILTILMIGVMFLVTAKLGGKSSTFFVKQQKDLGKVNGYIEEMLEGQKVVKVFCHEEKAKEGFNRINDELRVSAENANKFANILMPINNNLGHISYVLCAILGAVLALSGVTGLTLGTLISFLTLNKNFSQPITQVSQQINSVVMAMAGAKRVFDLIDETPETDDGYVELVNAKENADGTLSECEEKIGRAHV